MISAWHVAWWLVAAPPVQASEPAAEQRPFAMRVWGAVGASTRSIAPRLPQVPHQVARGAAFALGVTPQRRVAPRVRLVFPAAYASSVAAQWSDAWPLRTHRATIAADAQARVHSGRSRVWIGGGVFGSYAGLTASRPGPVRSFGFGRVGVRAPIELAVGRRVRVQVAPSLGLAIADARLAPSLPRAVGLAVGGQASVSIALRRRLAVTLRYTEQHGRWRQGETLRRDVWRLAVVGVELNLGADRPPRATVARPALDRPATSAPDPQPVRPAPALSGSTLAGRTVDLAALRGHVVVVDFWASWCGPCRAAMPGLQALSDELAGAGVVVIGVSVDEQADDAQAFAEAMHITFPLVVDSDHTLADAWQPPKMPTTYVIDESGMLVATFAGYSVGGHDTLRALVRRLATHSEAARAMQASGVAGP